MLISCRVRKNFSENTTAPIYQHIRDLQQQPLQRPNWQLVLAPLGKPPSSGPRCRFTMTLHVHVCPPLPMLYVCCMCALCVLYVCFHAGYTLQSMSHYWHRAARRQPWWICERCWHCQKPFSLLYVFLSFSTPLLSTYCHPLGFVFFLVPAPLLHPLSILKLSLSVALSFLLQLFAVRGPVADGITAARQAGSLRLFGPLSLLASFCSWFLLSHSFFLPCFPLVCLYAARSGFLLLLGGSMRLLDRP